jgi:hypothetical protein
MEQTIYHRFLRVAAVVCALVLVFDSGIISESTARLANGTQAYIATAVGVGASVSPTELNTLTAELTSRQRERLILMESIRQMANTPLTF